MSDLLNSASLVMIPSGYKEDVVYSQIPTNGNGDLSFTRASNGTRVNSAGLVEVCPWNLLDVSNTFSNANWGLSEATVTGSQAGYDGTNNAWKLQSSGGTSTYIVQGSFSTIRTQSIYAKAGTTSKFSIIVGGYGNGMQFDLSNGTIVTNSNSSYFSGSITSVGNGWYYIVVTIQAIAPTYGYLLATQNLGGGGISVGDYVFIQNAQVNIGSTAKPYFPTTDRLNVPRLTYQNGGGGCPSLLLEKQSTNLVTYSEQFDNAAWQTGGVSVTANQTISPDGTQNADLATTTNVGHFLYNIGVVTPSSVYTFSFYVKRGTMTDLKYRVYDNTNSVDIIVPTSYYSQTSNDWTRITITFTAPASCTSARVYVLSDSGVTGTAFFWGAQLEASSYPTSYIPTTSSSATRVADAMNVNLPNTNMTFTAYLELEEAPIATTAGDWFSIESNVSALGRAYGYANQFGFADAYSLGAVGATKMVWKQESGSTAKIFKGGALVGTSTTGTYTDPFNRLNVYGSNLDKPVKIKQFVFFDNALTDAECIALTTI